MKLVLTVLFLALIPPTRSHLCMLHPQQRGPIDVSGPGSHTCTRHGSCGGQDPSDPRYEFLGGRTEVFKWQQNLNHYSIGSPGYMDVALGTFNGSDPTEWTLLTAIGDLNEHAQAHQRNYTVTLVLPNIACEHCVLRMRYVAHKPGETPFVQCSDITVVHSDTRLEGPAPLSLRSQRMLPHRARKVLAFIRSRATPAADSPQKMYGFAYNPNRPDSSRSQTVDFVSGALEAFGDNIKYGFDTGKPYRLGYTQPLLGEYLLDQVLALDPVRGTTVVGFHTNSSLDAHFDSLMVLGTHNGSILGELKLSPLPEDPISAMLNVGPDQFIFLCIAEDKNKSGSFFFDWYAGDVTSLKRTYRSSTSEPLYFNYQWSEYDAATSSLYVLMGNENAPFRLNARIYTYDLNKDKMSLSLRSTAELVVDEYTVQSLHVEKGGSLVSLSPGLAFPAMYPAWHLVQINPTSGAITQLKQVTPSGLFTNKFGGTIFSAVDSNNTLTSVLRTDAGADVLVRVSIDSDVINFSSMSNFQHLHNLYIA